MTRRFPLAIAAVLSLTGLAAAQNTPAKPDAKPDTKPDTKADAAKSDKVLSVGDKAPALAVKEWVKGDPITGFEKGKVYVVEFWATWCGPCIASMPHLSELQKQYKDKGVTIVGVTTEDRRNTLEAVKKMVAAKGDTMGYTVGWDDAHKTYESYMNAAAQNGIPTSFIVNRDGVIAYIGHPMKINKTLEEVVANKQDIKAATAKYAQARDNEGKIEDIQRKLGEAAQAKDKAAAYAALDEWVKLSPDEKGDIELTRYQIAMKLFNDTETGYATAKANINGAWKDDAESLNAVAWMIVDPKSGITKPDIALAEQAAKRAVELSKGKEAAILDTMARVHFVKGEVDKAIEVETTAVGLADDQMKNELQTALDEFKAAKVSGKK
jgi:thiol-disulfide isomerase/thioredoxin